MGRALIWTGLLLLLVGVIVTFGGSLFNRIPGNFVIRGKGWTFYFPLGLCLLISLIGSLLMWLFGRK
jgi:hypothetical protein